MSIDKSGGAAMTVPREFNMKRLRLMAMQFSVKNNRRSFDSAEVRFAQDDSFVVGKEK
jgi:hypothetical protein